MNMVEVQGLHKHYGNENNLVKAVDGVDLCIEQGEFVALVGMSGSGKSTLLYMIGGLEQPTFGEIILDGAKISDMDSKTSEDVMALLKMTSKKFNQTILLITHNNEIAALADRRITIKDGKIIA